MMDERPRPSSNRDDQLKNNRPLRSNNVGRTSIPPEPPNFATDACRCLPRAMIGRGRTKVFSQSAIDLVARQHVNPHAPKTAELRGRLPSPLVPSCGDPFYIAVSRKFVYSGPTSRVTIPFKRNYYKPQYKCFVSFVQDRSFLCL